jgi:hypothetical protein
MKTSLALIALFTSITLSLAPAAQATTVWRCGSVYSDTPCAEGRAVDVADARTPEQVAAARQVLAADLRRADAMRRARLEQESARLPGPLSKKAPRAERQAQPQATRAKTKARSANAGTWRAVAPSSRRTKG